MPLIFIFEEMGMNKCELINLICYDVSCVNTREAVPRLHHFTMSHFAFFLSINIKQYVYYAAESDVLICIDLIIFVCLSCDEVNSQNKVSLKFCMVVTIAKGQENYSSTCLDRQCGNMKVERYYSEYTPFY